MSLREGFKQVLDEYLNARREPFSGQHRMSLLFKRLRDELANQPAVRHRPTLHVSASAGKGNWARVPWIAFLEENETTSTQEGVYPVFLFREDMTGFYLTFNQGVTKPKNQHGTIAARRLIRDRAVALRRYCGRLEDVGFSLDGEIDLRADTGYGADYEHSTVAYKYYGRDDLPTDDRFITDLAAVLDAYDAYLSDTESTRKGHPEQPSTVPESTVVPDFDIGKASQRVAEIIARQGFVFEPWQIAAFLTAVRTKPFVILAGVSGTGKSKLPALVAGATGSESRLIPVRPDWADSADVLGYVDLQGEFRPGAVLEVLHDAVQESDRFWFCVVDEMNLARVEQYFAEVLSRMEDRRAASGGGYESSALVNRLPREEDVEWTEIGIAANVAIVGTVNMDETTHGFSRKVLDRAFTLELSDVNLSEWGRSEAGGLREVMTWPVSAWHPRATGLADLIDASDDEREAIGQVILTLSEVNSFLTHAQLQIGYRTRDEVALFVLHARAIAPLFIDRESRSVDPLDLALQMKVLPRIAGGSGAIRRVILHLLGWAHGGQPFASEEEARSVMEAWGEAGRPGAAPDARMPRTAARLCIMWERLVSEGYTSFWL